LPCTTINLVEVRTFSYGLADNEENEKHRKPVSSITHARWSIDQG
jgi:hypothetical protein